MVYTFVPYYRLKKSEIVDYLEHHHISYLIDSTNESMDYLRNRIRTTIIPALQLCDERFNQNFQTTHAQLQATEDFLEHITNSFYQQVTQENLLAMNHLFSLHPFLQKRILLKWLITHKVPFTPSHNLLAEILRFLKKSDATTHTFYQKWQIKKNNEHASIIFSTRTDYL